MYYPLTNVADRLFKSARAGFHLPTDGLAETWVALCCRLAARSVGIHESIRAVVGGLSPELSLTNRVVNPLANTSAVIGGIMRVRKA